MLKSLIIIGMPRSGTSMTANLCINAGYNPNIFEDSKFFGGSPFNKGGYYEEVRLTLLNDQIIRMLHGNNYSFLYPPSLRNLNLSISKRDLKFQYDIDEKSLDIPNDYLEKIKNYTGTDNDIWGLTRMLPGKKWFKGYSKFGVNNFKGIRSYLDLYSKKLSRMSGYLIKDPRLCFTLQRYNLKKQKIIIVKRDGGLLKRSLINHYGPRYFTNKKYDNFNWISNHFNLKIKPITFKNFSDKYSSYIKKIKETHNNYLEISYESFINLNLGEISKFEDFIGAKIDKNLIMRK